MPTTPTYAFPYPADTDPADVPTDMQELADRCEQLILPRTVVDAKGDLIAATGPDAVARVAAGTDGQVLTADAASAAGVKWAAAAAGGSELAYAQAAAASVNIPTSNTEAAPLDIVSAGAVTFDGSPVIIEFFCGATEVGATAAALTGFSLWESTDLGRLGQLINSAAANILIAPVFARRKLTPTAGSHTYKVRAWAAVAAGKAHFGNGGAGSLPVGYLRITRA